MFRDITLGQYILGNSIIHKLDARLKIILTLLYIIVLFMIDNPICYILIALATGILLLKSEIPFKYFLKGLKPMLFIILFTVIINLFLTPGEAIWKSDLLGINMMVTKEGVKMAILIIVRLSLLVFLTSLLTLTTSPMSLTDGIERILSPLEIIKVPSHEIAMMMSIAIRFIPTIMEETEKIMKAQTARGADFESGNLIKRAKAMIPLLVPLFVSAFRRADELATAMDSRCYNSGNKRTRMKEMKFKKRDYLVLIGFILVSGMILFFQYKF